MPLPNLTPSRLAVAVALVLVVGSARAGIDPGLVERAAVEGRAPVLIALTDQARPSLAPLRPDLDALARRSFLVDALRARADVDQAGLREWLATRGIPHRAFWISNVIAAELAADEIEAVAARPEVAAVHQDAPLPQALPVPEPALDAVHADLATLTWGLEKINVATAWARGVRGAGVVVAGQDTGYRWNHPALKEQYRGWNGSSASHDYNWHDAIHESGTVCGGNSPVPCDDDAHGTHTMGTMVGGVSGNGTAIGIAPEARWIGCRNMRDGWGTPARYIECMEWLLAPTDLAGNNPDPARAPDLVNNSWGCVPEEGCTTGQEVRAAVENLVAGGILFVAAAGNDGSSCGSIHDAPATYAASFTVAATDSSDALTGFSSRGPIAGSTGPSIDLAAPGSGVYSSVPNSSYGNMSGTSMAAPHVAGVAALVMSVNPALRGDPEAVADILRASAVRSGITDPWRGSCGGLSMSNWPNHQAGWGRLDAWAAVRLADTLFADDFDP